MAELYGRATGCSGGRGGSMHMYAPEYGFMGTNGMVGAGLPLATGAALSAQLRKSGQIAVCFFGDGAVNSGSFHESLNFGAIWNLPVVYVCENNLYATEMAFSRATKNPEWRAAQRLSAAGREVDGNDVLAVYEAAGEAVCARAQRRRTHLAGSEDVSVSSAITKATPAPTIAPGKNSRTGNTADPIKRFREKMTAAGRIAADEFDGIVQETNGLVHDAVEFARTSPDPVAETVLDHV